MKIPETPAWINSAAWPWLTTAVTTKRSASSAWSRSLNIAIVLSIPSVIDGFFGRAQRGHRYDDTAPCRTGLVGQFTAETLHYRARHKKAQAPRLSTALKRPEQIFRTSDADAGILEADNHPGCFLRRCYTQPLRLRELHCTLAILGQIQEDLNESVAVRPN